MMAVNLDANYASTAAKHARPMLAVHYAIALFSDSIDLDHTVHV